jgi:hypothetical protein
MLRLVRQGKVLQIPQPKDRPYIYKHPESNVRHNSSKLEHYLAIVDTYIELKQPEFFVVEPDWASYRPDVYCRVGHMLWCIEVQRSKITNGKMQRKINEFVRSYRREEHDATNLWIKTGFTWNNLQAPENMDIKISPTW